MGIEKMTFLDINGNTEHLDQVLRIAIKSELFQPEYAAKLSEYSIGSNAFLRNPYGALLVKINDMAAQMKITPAYTQAPEPDYDRDMDAYIDGCHDYLNKLRREYPAYFDKQSRLAEEIESYTSALDMLGHINVSEINFDNIWQNEFLKVRFGRLPAAQAEGLAVYEDKPYELYRLEETGGFLWCLYFTAEEYKDDIDKMFFTLGFERLMIPDYVKGTAEQAIKAIREGLGEERTLLEKAEAETKEFIAGERRRFLQCYCAVKFLHDAYDLRKYVVTIRDRFHLLGFVQAKDAQRLQALLATVPDLAVNAQRAEEQSRLPVPVLLKNNLFVRPFEMFVQMYGAPSYRDIDPTPFLAYTYTLLFGIMFGDLGQGLAVAALGYFLWKKKGMALGGIMTRIGAASMVFGFLYGSVFGFEHLLDGFYINVLGLHEKPIEVLHPDTTNKILIAAIVVGALSIVSAIIFNIITGLRQRDFDRALLSSNGLCGLVFYGGVLFGAVGTLQGLNIFTPLYILAVIVLPLVLIFLREPIIHYAQLVNKDTMISHDENLTGGTLLDQKDTNIPELFSSPFMIARFGRIPTDSYRKLAFYQNEPFMLYPIKTDPEYLWLVYATPLPSKEEIDAIFHDLYFERIYIPDEDMDSPEGALRFIKRCIEMGAAPDKAPAEAGKDSAPRRAPTLLGRIFPEGIGNFFTVTFFEMFEVVLSFVSNTMSFLRVGGFVLVHAGMMSVVFTLAQMVNSGGASIFIIIFGNLFVMAMEGLIVGIQVLRLEFYEMFSRFYGANGDLFLPAKMVYHDPA